MKTNRVSPAKAAPFAIDMIATPYGLAVRAGAHSSADVDASIAGIVTWRTAAIAATGMLLGALLAEWTE